MTAKQRELTDREHLMVAALPRHNWNIEQAGIEAGYSPSNANSLLTHRAKHDISLREAIVARRQEIEALAAKRDVWTLEGWQEELDDAIARVRTQGNASAPASLLLQKGRTAGAFAEDDTQRNAARQIQIVRPEQQRPRERVPCTVVDMANRTKALVERRLTWRG